jgi:hypothetical protein
LQFTKNNWKVTRLIGVGDREVVRAGLLQVGYLMKGDTETAIKAGLKAAQHLEKILRFYYNQTRLTDTENNHLIFGVMGNARNHDLMEESLITRERFNWVLGRCDLIVEGHGSQQDLTALLLEAWTSTKERELLINDRFLSDEDIRKKFPQFFGREDEFWKLWSN